MRTIPVAIAALILSLAIPGASAVAQSTPAALTGPLTIDGVPSVLTPGETLTLTGTGCRPTGAFPVSGDPLAVLFGPAEGNSFLLTVGTTPGEPREIGIAMTVNDVSGEQAIKVTPEVGGSWIASFAVPADAPTGSDYRISVVCATNVVPLTADPQEPDLASPCARATVTALSVDSPEAAAGAPLTENASSAPCASADEALVVPTTAAVPASRANAPASVDPRFAG